MSLSDSNRSVGTLNAVEKNKHNYNTVQRETFEGENFRGSGKCDLFVEKTFVECKNLTQVGMARPNFKDTEKTFTGSSKTTKFVNIFSLERFPLYSI